MGSLSCRYFEHLSSSIAMRSRLQFFVSRLATVKNFGIPDFWHQLLQHIAFYRKNLFVWLNYSYILSYSTLRSKISTVWNPRNLGTFFFQKLWFPKSGSWKYSRWAVCKTVLWNAEFPEFQTMVTYLQGTFSCCGILFKPISYSSWPTAYFEEFNRTAYLLG